MTGRHDVASLLRLPAVAEAVLGAAPAWLWDVEAGRVLAASAAGAAFFEARDSAELAKRSFDMRRPAMMQLSRLSDQLPANGAPRMAMLRFFVGLRDVSVAGRCRIVDPFRRDLVLVLAVGLPADRRPLRERAQTVLGALELPAVVRGPAGEVYRNAAAADSEFPADAEGAVRLDGGDGPVELFIGVAEGGAGTGAVEAEAPAQAASEPPPDETSPGEPSDEPSSAAAAEQPPGKRRLPETRRFTFLLDADGRLVELGAGFAGIVGPASADIVERTWAEIAARHGLDPDGRIAAAIESRETWSDMLVDWPTDFGDLVRLRLSALPRYGEGRAFVGFRGFADALAILPAPGPESSPAEVPRPDAAGGAAPAAEGAAAGPGEDTAEREGEAGDIVFAEPEDIREPIIHTPAGIVPRVVHLGPDAGVGEERTGLNERERTAFRAIAQALGARLPDEEAPRAGEPAETEPPEAMPPVAADEQAGADVAAGRENSDADAVADDASTQPDGVSPDAADGSGEETADEPAAATTLALPEPPEDHSTEAVARPAAPEAASAELDIDPAEPRPAAAPAFDAELAGELLDRVPLGLAVVRDARILVANRAFLGLFDFAGLDDLDAAGGLAGLLEAKAPADDDEHTRVVARRRDGTLMPVVVHLARTPWIDGPAMLISARLPEPPEPAPLPASEPTVREAPADNELADLRAVVAMAVDGVLVLTADGAIASANPGARQLIGGLESELLGRPLVDCVAPGSRSHAIDLIEGLKSGGVPSVLAEGREIRLASDKGDGTPVRLTVGRIGSGEPPRFCAVLRDLTERKAADTALVDARRRAEEASAQKSDFLAKISHEIRTPLNGIIGFSEVMAEERFGPLGNERYREYVKDIRASGEHIMSLVNDLLDLSKVEAGKLELAFAGVRLNDLVEQTVAIVGPQAHRSQIIIRTSLAATLPPVVADARSIRQVVLNLLSNAIKFTLPGGQVFVSTVRDETGEVVLRVRDTGIGMSEPDIAAAMEPFRQLAVAGSDRERGTGLGLPLSKALTEANRASFTITSRTDEGTMIEIRFPQSRVLSE